MRHGKTINHLGRTASHRNAMLANMASSLIMHKRVTTTVAKAKALRQFVEPLLTKSKNDTTHSRRTVFSVLENKETLKELFGDVAAKIANRPGGYTRIIKLSQSRLGDNADMCIIELVDYNETLLEAKTAGEAKTTTTRRSRGKKKSITATAGEGESSAEVVADAPVAAAPTTEVSAPEDTPTDTLKEGETRDEKKDEESAS
ncbi:50S ribosomal protein L17 [Hymenobacter sp. BT186]|uniref:Large ribosomal subunit protein bL17 n=1 Tax=Hymenobacter telluris TaxID=2816474 RepID=A0A939JCD1_9BACT|nr:50S ribosomal protein L17 [Hymenobacter telluris]MBO0357177.1 50S ribosomal protein L17 [Hymenobacter telluris]MBW3373204.1 50S ribosomal protein L17 [Hymenobacter norwichensis]